MYWRCCMVCGRYLVEILEISELCPWFAFSPILVNKSECSHALCVKAILDIGWNKIMCTTRPTIIANFLKNATKSLAFQDCERVSYRYSKENLKCQSKANTRIPKCQVRENIKYYHSEHSRINRISHEEYTGRKGNFTERENCRLKIAYKIKTTKWVKSITTYV